MVDNLLVSSPHADKIFSWGIPQTPLKNRTVNFEKCTKCKLGDWGFPQSVKSQKSVCGGALQIGFFAFYFRKWLSTCYACQYESSPLRGVAKSSILSVFLERKSGYRAYEKPLLLGLVRLLI